MKLKPAFYAALLIVAGFVDTASALPNGQGREPDMKVEFFKAIIDGDLARVKGMLKAHPSLASSKDHKGLSAILKAVYYGKKEVAAALVSTGVDLDIFEASATGQTLRIRALLKQDATLVNTFAPDGFLPLGLAVFFGHQEAVEALLAAGAEVNVTSREAMKVTPLHSAAAARRLSIARLLIANGAKVNAGGAESGLTPLHEAAANGDIELAKLLLEHHAGINAKTNDGKTPLAFAISSGQTEMATFLRERGEVQ